jgi:ATP:corrinoid adenosyltransferase
VGFLELPERPKWFRYNELAWHGSIVEREWKYYYANNETIMKVANVLPRPAYSMVVLDEVAVCIENLIRFECLTESLNVSDHGRTVMLLSDAVGLAVQIE